MKARSFRCPRALSSNSAAGATTRAPCPRAAVSPWQAQCDPARLRAMQSPVPTRTGRSLLLAASMLRLPFTVATRQNTCPTLWSISTSNRSSLTQSPVHQRTRSGLAATRNTSSTCPASPTSPSRFTSETPPHRPTPVATKTSSSEHSRSTPNSRSKGRTANLEMATAQLARPVLIGYQCSLAAVR